MTFEKFVQTKSFIISYWRNQQRYNCGPGWENMAELYKASRDKELCELYNQFLRNKNNE
jgi:hypothetical protein